MLRIEVGRKLPAFAGHAYTHWTFNDLGPNGPSALKTVLLHPDRPIRRLSDAPA